MNAKRISAARITHKGKFVQLRPIQLEDASLTLTWRMGKRATLLSDGAETVETQSDWIGSRPLSELNFIIEVLPGAFPVGMISLVDIDFASRRAEPARFLIGEESLTRGLPVAAEALSLLYALAFGSLHLLEVYGTMSEDNISMLKWHRYLGAKETGYLPKKVRIDGKLKSLMGIVLSQEDYWSLVKPKLDTLISFGSVESTREQEIE